MKSRDLQRLKVYVRRLRGTLSEIAQKQARRAQLFEEAFYSIDKIQDILGHDEKVLRGTRDYGQTKKKESHDRIKPNTKQFSERSQSSSQQDQFQKVNGIVLKCCQQANNLCRKVNSLVKIKQNKDSHIKDYKQYLKQQTNSKNESRQSKEDRIKKPKPSQQQPTPKRREYSDQFQKQDEDILKLFQAIKEYM